MKLINLNCITNSCKSNTYVTWRGNEYELSEDEHDSVETCSSVIIYKLIEIVVLLFILQHKIPVVHLPFSINLYCCGILQCDSMNRTPDSTSRFLFNCHARTNQVACLLSPAF